LSKLQAVFLLTHVAVASRQIVDTNLEFSVGQGYARLAEDIASLAEAVSDWFEDAQKRRVLSNLSTLFDSTYTSLRSLSQIVKNCDAPFILDIAALIETVLRCSIRVSEDAEQRKDLRRRDDFEKHLSSFTHLPYWFVHHAPSFESTHAFDLLADTPIKVGLLLIQRKAWPDKAVETAKSAFAVTKEMLAKGKNRYGYDEARHMLSICFLGVLARAKSDALVLQAVVAAIREFDEAYKRAYVEASKATAGSVGANQLLIEALRWREEFERDKYNRPPMMDRSSDLILRWARVDDVDRFLHEVWASFRGTAVSLTSSSAHY
jgi:hypothetical protein